MGAETNGTAQHVAGVLRPQGLRGASLCTSVRAVLWPRGLWHTARLIHMAGHEPGPSLLCIVGRASSEQRDVQ